MFIVKVTNAHHKIWKMVNTIKEKLKTIYYLTPKYNHCYHFSFINPFNHKLAFLSLKKKKLKQQKIKEINFTG